MSVVMSAGDAAAFQGLFTHQQMVGKCALLFDLNIKAIVKWVPSIPGFLNPAAVGVLLYKHWC